MRDVAVALDPHQLGHGDAAGTAHPAEVVAPEVHEHQVLGPLLLVREQLLLAPRVFFRGGRRADACRPGDASPRAGPRRGPASPGDAPATAVAPSLQEEHVGRRVHHAQGAVDREADRPRRAPCAGARARPGRCRRPRCTPWPGAPPPGRPASSAGAASPVADGTPRGAWADGTRGGPLPARPAPPGPRSNAARASGLDVRDEHEALAHVVERDQRVVDRERGQRPPVLRMAVGQALEEPCRVVGEIADGPAREAEAGPGPPPPCGPAPRAAWPGDRRPRGGSLRLAHAHAGARARCVATGSRPRNE